MLSNPVLWEKLENECRRIAYGELHIVVKIEDGIPQGVDVERERISIRERISRKRSDEII